MKKPLLDTSTLTNSQKIQAKYFFVALPFMFICLFLFESWFARGFWIVAILIASAKAGEKAVKKAATEKVVNQ
jgi:hypothetical protein